MISFIFSFFLIFSNGLDGKAIDPCEVYGKIYIEQNPGRADYRVYIEESETFADLIVYKQENALFADKAGQWAFVENKGFANVYIYMEKRRNMADFTIAFTDIESFAGCNK